MPAHFRTIPKKVHQQLQLIENKSVVAGCLVVTKRTDLLTGLFSHIGISLDTDGVHYSQEVLPWATRGKWSRRNTVGWEEVRHDWPREQYSVALEAPNWGNSGTHTVYQTRERFPRLHHAPSYSTICIECVDPSPGRETYVFKCHVSDILDRDAPRFAENLLRCLNLLQENLGLSGVVKANATIADYTTSIQVAWEVLPPGTPQEAIARLFGQRKPTVEQSFRVEQRYRFLMSLRPKAFVYGRSGFQRYFGAKLRDDLVVFENVEHGNAMYIMFSDWETLSQKSRVDLLSGRYGKNFERVVHLGDWESRVRRIVQ